MYQKKKKKKPSLEIHFQKRLHLLKCTETKPGGTERRGRREKEGKEKRGCGDLFDIYVYIKANYFFDIFFFDFLTSNNLSRKLFKRDDSPFWALYHIVDESGISPKKNPPYFIDLYLFVCICRYFGEKERS